MHSYASDKILTNKTSYHYIATNLLIAYSISAFFTTVCVALGLWAMYDNGVSHSMSFSSLVATTRNPTLDNLFVGEGLGADPMSENVLREKLRFGVLQDGHVGFGLAEEVLPLKGGGEGKR